MNKKQKIIIISAAVLLVIIIAAGYIYCSSAKKTSFSRDHETDAHKSLRPSKIHRRTSMQTFFSDLRFGNDFSQVF